MKNDGQAERITTFEKTDSGLRITADSFSTYVIGWKDAAKQESHTDNGGGESHDSDNNAQGAQTGDSAAPVIWLLCCGAALSLILILRKRSRI